MDMGGNSAEYFRPDGVQRIKTRPSRYQGSTHGKHPLFSPISL